MRHPVFLAFITFLILAGLSAIFVQSKKNYGKLQLERVAETAKNYTAYLAAGDTVNTAALTTPMYKSYAEDMVSEYGKKIAPLEKRFDVIVDSANIDTSDTSKAKAAVLVKNLATTTAFRFYYDLEKSGSSWWVNNLKVKPVYNAFKLGFQFEIPDGFIIYSPNYYSLMLKRDEFGADGKKKWIRINFENFALLDKGGVYEDLKDFVYKAHRDRREYAKQYTILSERAYTNPKISPHITEGVENRHTLIVEGEKVVSWDVILLYGDSIRTFSYWAVDDQYEKFLPAAQEVFNSWKIGY